MTSAEAVAFNGPITELSWDTPVAEVEEGGNPKIYLIERRMPIANRCVLLENGGHGMMKKKNRSVIQEQSKRVTQSPTFGRENHERPATGGNRIKSRLIWHLNHGHSKAADQWSRP